MIGSFDMESKSRYAFATQILQSRVIAESVPGDTAPRDAADLMHRYADDSDATMTALPPHYRLALRQRLSRLVIPPVKAEVGR
jgi:hypothetical protein